jgi:imidazolonepropionase-like amidohydrolase
VRRRGSRDRPRGHRGSETTRLSLKVGFAADILAVNGNPLERIGAMRDVRFVM